MLHLVRGGSFRVFWEALLYVHDLRYDGLDDTPRSEEVRSEVMCSSQGVVQHVRRNAHASRTNYEHLVRILFTDSQVYNS